jgi:predicted GIY-YIG superfamily endonuclease
VTYLYQLKFPNGKRYVGISNNVESRYREHLRNAEKGTRIRLCCAIRKYGAPELKVLAAGSRVYALALEIKAIAAWRLRDHKHGYNDTPGGDGITEYSPALRRKLSRSKKKFYAAGRGYTPAWRAKISVAMLGRVVAPATCAKLSAAAKKRWRRPGFREKTSESVRIAMNKPEVKAATTARLEKMWAEMPKKKKRAIYRKVGLAKRGQRQSRATVQKRSFAMKWSWAQKKAAREMWALAA